MLLIFLDNSSISCYAGTLDALGTCLLCAIHERLSIEPQEMCWWNRIIPFIEHNSVVRMTASADIFLRRAIDGKQVRGTDGNILQHLILFSAITLAPPETSYALSLNQGTSSAEKNCFHT